MTVANLLMPSIVLPPFYTGWAGSTPTFASTTAMSASTHQVHITGRVINKDFATKNLQTIGVLTGTCSVNAASTIQFALQDTDAANGGPARGDGVDDQTVSVAGTALTSNTWVQTGNLSATRSVAHGDRLTVVISYTSFTAADSITFRHFTASSGPHTSQVVYYNGATYSLINATPNIILGFDDGTFGTLEGAFPCSDYSTITFNSGSTPDENALTFQFPYPVTVDRLGGLIAAVSTGTFDLVLYSGTTALASVSVDPQHLNNNSASSVRWLNEHITPQALSANTTYRVALKPTSANNVYLGYIDVNTANHMQAHMFGTNGTLSTRTDGGAWSETTTRRPILWVGAKGFDDGTAGGGVTAHIANQNRGLA